MRLTHVKLIDVKDNEETNLYLDKPVVITYLRDPYTTIITKKDDLTPGQLAEHEARCITYEKSLTPEELVRRDMFRAIMRNRKRVKYETDRN